MVIKRRKKNKVTTPRVIAFIAYTLILFFGATIVVNMNPNANEDYRLEREERNNKSMKWIFKTQSGDEYNLFDTRSENEHWAAMSYDFLMPPTLDEINDQVQKEKEQKAKLREEMMQKELLNETPEVADIESWEAAFIPVTTQIEETIDEELEHGSAPDEQPLKTQEEIDAENNSWDLKTPTKAYDELWDTLEDRSAFLNMVFEYLLAWKLQQLPEWAVRYVVTLYWIDEATQDLVFEERPCMTPWWYEIEHGQSVLAYQQRSDATNICNIQRRICKNWKLSWSYTQASCDETLWNDWSANWVQWAYWTVKKIAYSTYNSVKLDEFIQPPEYASNEFAEFDVHWKLVKWKQEPKMQKLWNSDALSPEPVEVAQERSLWKTCKTPRWETVQPGQFVKAYRFQNGFIDIPCQVQLRTCVDWKLEGMYQYSSCQPWSTSYEDFIYWYMDSEQPAPQRLLKMLQTDFQPKAEYGSNLSSEIIDKMIKILNDK